MAVAVEMNFPGATIEQYDEILGKMGLTPGGATPPGAIRVSQQRGSKPQRGPPRSGRHREDHRRLYIIGLLACQAIRSVGLGLPPPSQTRQGEGDRRSGPLTLTLSRGGERAAMA